MTLVMTHSEFGWLIYKVRKSTRTLLRIAPLKTHADAKLLFQNPLRQNYRHTRCLAEFLNLDHDLLHSVVFFIGDIELKTSIPDNVLTKGLSNYIRRFTRPVLSPAKVLEIERRLKTLQAGTTVSRSEHLES